MAYFNQHQSMISKRYLTFFSKSKKKKPFSAGQLIGLILGPLLFLLTLLFFHPQDLPWKGVYVLAITLWIATWWIYFGNCNGKMEFTYESSVDNY